MTRGVSPEGYEDFGGRAALGSQVFPECGGVRPLLVINELTEEAGARYISVRMGKKEDGTAFSADGSVLLQLLK